MLLGANEVAIAVPRSLPRLVRLPDKVTPTGMCFVSLSSIVRAHLDDLFPGREVTEFSQFRVTRHSDMALDEEDVRNLRTALRQGCSNGTTVRPCAGSVGKAAPPFVRLLLEQFALPPATLFRVPGPVNLVRLSQLVDLVNDPALLFPP